MDDLMKDLKNKNEKFSEEYMTLMKQYYEKLVTNQATQGPINPNQPDEEGGLVITPNPCCCIKALDSNGQKIFINVTSHDKIEAPKEEHILEMENQMGVRLPMSLSEKAEDFDNKNQICQVYDVIFNTSVLKKADGDPSIFQFMYQVIRERIRQRFSHQLSEAFTKLRNLKYKGKAVRQQRVRVKTGPKIEEVLNPEKENKNFNMNLNESNPMTSKEISKVVNEKGKTPNWNLVVLKNKEINLHSFDIICKKSNNILERNFSLDSFTHNNNSGSFFLFYDGFNANPKHGHSLLYIVEMNLISKSVGISLEISEEGMMIDCPKIYSLEINFPFRINSNDSFSIFDSTGRFLYIILPFYDKDCQEFQKLEDQSCVDQNINVTDDYLFDLVV